jgi:hypothetical protein
MLNYVIPSESKNVGACFTNDELPEEIQESILELKNLSTHLHYGIVSASVAFLAGYVAKTIEERIECEVCLNSILTEACSIPLLALINLQNHGGLRYPSENFTFLINQLIQLVLNTYMYLNTYLKNAILVMY